MGGRTDGHCYINIACQCADERQKPELQKTEEKTVKIVLKQKKTIENNIG